MPFRASAQEQNPQPSCFFRILICHIVWSTKYREPTITVEREISLYDLIRSKAFGLEGNVYALNGDVDHVHLVASIPPKIAVARFVGQVKGVSSVRYNDEFRADGEPSFYWQDGYGVFSFDKKRLPYVVEYVRRQKEHHQTGKVIPLLEKCPDAGGEDRPVQVADDEVVYLTDYDKWLRSMQG